MLLSPTLRHRDHNCDAIWRSIIAFSPVGCVVLRQKENLGNLKNHKDSKQNSKVIGKPHEGVYGVHVALHNAFTVFFLVIIHLFIF